MNKTSNKTANKTANKATNRTKDAPSWREIEGKKVGIYAQTFDDYVAYSTSTYRKKDDEYINAYIPVDFPYPDKRPDIDEGAFDIIVEKCFLSAYVDKNGIGRIKMVVIDWRYADES